ncbi:MAG: hypothetical protein QOJ42_1517, partial [Acidobacteriaceae bacterium]|nr:hypothetical protein [Acidobacteriaceae bacterium]
MDEFLHHFTYCYKLAAVEASANCPEDNAVTGYPFPRLTPWNPGGRRRWLVHFLWTITSGIQHSESCCHAVLKSVLPHFRC